MKENPPNSNKGEQVTPIYVDLASESDDPHVTEVPSLCMTCHEMVSYVFLVW